jgi:hypothetical protein
VAKKPRFDRHTTDWGYEREQFADAWERYLDASTPSTAENSWDTGQARDAARSSVPPITDGFGTTGQCDESNRMGVTPTACSRDTTEKNGCIGHKNNRTPKPAQSNDCPSVPKVPILAGTAEPPEMGDCPMSQLPEDPSCWRS